MNFTIEDFAEPSLQDETDKEKDFGKHKKPF